MNEREGASSTHWEVNTESFSCDFELVCSVSVCLWDCEIQRLEIKWKAVP